MVKEKLTIFPRLYLKIRSIRNHAHPPLQGVVVTGTLLRTTEKYYDPRIVQHNAESLFHRTRRKVFTPFIGRRC